MSFDTDELVSAYVAIRDERERLKREYEAADSVLTDQMSQLEQVMLGICNEVNADSIKTKHGLMIRQVKERFICGDWDNFGKFIVEHNAVPLLEKRIHQGNFKSFMLEHEGEGLPPGVNVMREYGITVRRASSK